MNNTVSDQGRQPLPCSICNGEFVQRRAYIESTITGHVFRPLRWYCKDCGSWVYDPEQYTARNVKSCEAARAI